MKFYQSNLLTNTLVFALGLLFIIFPTALTSTGLNNTNSFYPDLFLCFIFATALNRPNIINLYAILTLLLFSDVLHMKPIGLFTILMFTSVVIIRRYKLQIEQSPFYIHFLIFLILLSCVQNSQKFQRLKISNWLYSQFFFIINQDSSYKNIGWENIAVT